MKNYLIFSLILLFAISSFAQTTVSLPEIETIEQTEVVVPISVNEDITNVGSFTFNVEYDQDVLDFAGVYENAPETGTFELNYANGVVSIGWFDTTPIVLSGSIIDLKFTYKTGTSNLSFINTNEITDATGNPINLTFSDGFVREMPIQVSLGKKSVDVGELVNIPLSVKNFKDIHSITFFVEYDETVVTFDSLANDLVGFTYEANNGVLSIGWFDASTPAPVVTGKLADLVFTVNQGATDLVFGANCEVTDITSAPLTVVYQNGFVSDLLNQPASISLADVVSVKNSSVAIALSGKGLNNLGSFTLRVDYDPTVISYTGFENVIAGSFNANEVNGTLTMGYFNAAGVNVGDDKIVDLLFDYVEGSSDLMFDGSFVEVTDANDVIMNVTLIDGSISENFAPVIDVPVKDTTIVEGDSLYFTVTADDQDGDDVVISATNLPDGASFENDEFTWKPGLDQAGNYVVYFTAEDVHGATSTDSTMIEVLNFNSAPYFTAVIGEDEIQIDSSNHIPIEDYVFQYEGEDPDGDDITFALSEAEGTEYADITVDSDGLLTIEPIEANMVPEAVYVFTIITSLTDGEFTVYDTSVVTYDKIVDVNEEIGIPSEYKVFQNYPNPFNPTSTIKFGLPAQSHVSIVVFNSIGQQVTTLADNDFSAGYHTVKFNAVNLSSGIYFYSIKASSIDGTSDFATVKKMMLLK